MISSKPETFSWRQLTQYALIAVVSAALTLSAIWAFPQTLLPPRLTISSINAAVQPPPQPQTATPVNSPQSFVTSAVQRVGTAVVRIDTERVVTNPGINPFFDDPFFREFFGGGVPQNPQEYRQRGEGSGLIIESNGLILTNAHVVSGADTVTVTLKEGRQFTGKVRGMDEPSDLAVVKIEGRDLPVAPLGDSSQLKVGDWAIAVGNPLGLDNTVTLGIISTLNRSSAQVGIPDKRLDFIQTDAAINPGNSGGPLLNERGEVIGINTAIRADAQGIGFAIPINKAKAIKDKLARGEQIPHPYIGVRLFTLTPEIAQQINSDPNGVILVPEINGVLIEQVMPNSPAATAGIRRGDVIFQIDGKPITTAEQLQDAVEQSQINQPLKMQIKRGEQTVEISVRPGNLQDAL
ncbi:MAG: trypsin-like peptidase domain-containing protein [Desertifilum sp.]|nr:trypsin-like peptidase domain-containing protein [Desertifilum sp.]